MKKITWFLIAIMSFMVHGSIAQKGGQEYKVIKTIPVDGNGGWDYLIVDKPTQRLFVSHGTCVDVVDLKTLKVLDKVPTGKNPDAILYDPFRNRIFTFNGRGSSVTAIDAKTNQVAGTLPVSGKPEAAVTDGKGKIFCNIEDKSTVVKFDALTLKIEAEWPLDPGKEPTGLGFDPKTNRLFSACSESNQMVAQTLATRKSARTITYDETTKRIYLSSADVSMENGKRSIIPRSFEILVVGK